MGKEKFFLGRPVTETNKTKGRGEEKTKGKKEKKRTHLFLYTAQGYTKEREEEKQERLHVFFSFYDSKLIMRCPSKSKHDKPPQVAGLS